MFVQNLFDKIGQTAARHPERPAIFEGEKTHSYKDFHAAISRICARLLQLNLAPGGRAGIFLGNSYNGYVSVYATALAGLTYVPLPTDDPPARLKQMIEDAGLACILCDARGETFLRQVPGLNLPELVKVDGGEEAGAFESGDLRGRTGEDFPLYMLFTSGSTGVPKGVLISREGVENFVLWAKEYLQVQAQDIFLAHSRLTFDLSVFNLYVPFFEGAAVRIVQNPVEQMYPGALLQKNVTIALMVPRVTGLMLQAGQLGPNAYPKLRHVLFCGEKLLAAQVAAWMQTHPSLSVHNIYGPTETTVTCSYHRMESGSSISDPVPIGKSIPNMELVFLDEHQNVIEGAAEGELIIAGPGVSPRDYDGRQTDRFFDHPLLGRCFRSGDLVKRNSDEVLYWLTRLDDQIKIRGFRVELSEVESVLSRHPAILDLICVYNPEKQSLTSCMTLKENAQKERVTEELKKISLEKLPAYMRPTVFVVMESLPRNSNGKVERKKIEQMLGERLVENGI